MVRFSTAGESHGEALIALVSGLPAGVPVDLEFVNRDLWRRQQGYGRGGRMPDGSLSLLPGDFHTDGFFVARIEKEA